MYYGEIKNCDIANGEGVRVSLFVSGCTLHCKGCFNPETWDFTYGQPFDEKAQARVLDALVPSYIDGLSVLGGEPLEPPNQHALLPFLRTVRRMQPKKSIWLYTGYIYECDLCAGGRVYGDDTDELLSLVDVLVDGAYVEAQRNIALSFRGSANQRLIDVPRSRAAGKTISLRLEGERIHF